MSLSALLLYLLHKPNLLLLLLCRLWISKYTVLGWSLPRDLVKYRSLNSSMSGRTAGGVPAPSILWLNRSRKYSQHSCTLLYSNNDILPRVTAERKRILPKSTASNILGKMNHPTGVTSHGTTVVGNVAVSQMPAPISINIFVISIVTTGRKGAWIPTILFLQNLHSSSIVLRTSIFRKAINNCHHLS